MLPPETKNPRRGFPKTAILSGFFQSGCEIIPTVYPLSSKILLIIAGPKEG